MKQFEDEFFYRLNALRRTTDRVRTIEQLREDALEAFFTLRLNFIFGLYYSISVGEIVDIEVTVASPKEQLVMIAARGFPIVLKDNREPAMARHSACIGEGLYLFNRDES